MASLSDTIGNHFDHMSIQGADTPVPVPVPVPDLSGDGDGASVPDLPGGGDAPPSPSPICPESGTLPGRPRPRPCDSDLLKSGTRLECCEYPKLGPKVTLKGVQVLPMVLPRGLVP